MSLLYGCTIAELKAVNNLFSDSDLHTRLTLSVPNRKHVPVDKLIVSSFEFYTFKQTIKKDVGAKEAKNDSETSSTGDVDVATQKLFDRIGKWSAGC